MTCIASPLTLYVNSSNGVLTSPERREIVAAVRRKLGARIEARLLVQVAGNVAQVCGWGVARAWAWRGVEDWSHRYIGRRPRGGRVWRGKFGFDFLGAEQREGRNERQRSS